MDRALNSDELETMQSIMCTVAKKCGFNGEDATDLVQEMITEWFEKDYTAKYDPERSFTTFVYSFAIVRAKRQWTRNSTDPCFRADNIDILRERQGWEPMEYPVDFDEKEKRRLFVRKLYRAKKALERYPSRGTVFYQNRMYDRSLLQLLQFMLDGIGRKDIQRILHYSCSTVSNMVTELRCVPEVREVFKFWYGRFPRRNSGWNGF